MKGFKRCVSNLKLEGVISQLQHKADVAGRVGFGTMSDIKAEKHLGRSEAYQDAVNLLKKSCGCSLGRRRISEQRRYRNYEEAR